MNVLMIAYSLYPYDPRIRREAEALARNGDKVTFFVLMEGEEPKTYDSNGVTIVELASKKYRGGSSLSYILSYLRFLMLSFVHCTAHLFKYGVDVVHVHNMPDFLVFAGIVPKLFGKKMILDIHDSMPETYEGKFRNLSGIFHRILCLEEQICSALADRVICVNEVQKEVLVRRGISSQKIAVILNVPDEEIFRYQEKSNPDINKQTFDIVYHGTIDRMLGLDLMIDAMPRLMEKIPGVNFHVIGSGPHLDSLVEKTRKAGLEERIHFSMKAVPVTEIPDILKKMDVGVVPNKRNTATELMLPVKLLEYVAVGLPAVAPRLKTVQYYFTEDMVTYFEPDDVYSLVNAIISLHQNKHKKEEKARNARRFIDQFGWEKHQLDLVRLYAGLH